LTYGVCSLTAEKVKKDKSADAAEAKDLDDDGEPKKKSAAKKDQITTYYTVHLDSGEEHHTTDLPSLTFCCDVALPLDRLRSPSDIIVALRTFALRSLVSSDRVLSSEFTLFLRSWLQWL